MKPSEMTVIAKLTNYHDYDWNWEAIECRKDSDGQYWLGTDDGCSCYSPFENYADDTANWTGPLTCAQAVAEFTNLALTLIGGANEAEYGPVTEDEVNRETRKILDSSRNR